MFARSEHWGFRPTIAVPAVRTFFNFALSMTLASKDRLNWTLTSGTHASAFSVRPTTPISAEQVLAQLPSYQCTKSGWFFARLVPQKDLFILPARPGKSL